MTAILIALALGRPLPLVSAVVEAALSRGLDPRLTAALVEGESGFDPAALGDDGTSWGLFQLCSRWHPQWRGSLTLHIYYGTMFLAELLEEEHDTKRALERYNAGRVGTRSGTAYAERILGIYHRIGGQE